MKFDYMTHSPTSHFMSMGSMGPGSAYGGSQSGSDYGFDTPQHAMNGNGLVNGYTSAPLMPGAVQPYHNGFDANMMPSPPIQQGLGIGDAQSPVLGHHHRLSVSSNGPYAGMVRQNSFGGSDTTSPGGQRGQAPFAENQFGSENNDAVTSQPASADAGKQDDNQTGAPPPWSELKTKAGKERKRLPLACIACRRKKIRCSGEKPACKHCLRSRIPCVYKVTTRKAAPRTDYMAMLDKRLKRMEERVIKCIPKEEQAIVNNTGRAVVKPPLPPPPPKSAGGSKKRGAEQAFGDELEDWAESKATRPVSRAEPAEEKSFDADGEKPASQEEHSLLHEGADKLPSKELQEHLAEVFFDYVYGQSYHLLHKPSFMRKLAQGTVPPVLMLAVCAISARFSNHPHVRTEPAFLRGENWASAAREIALRRYDTPNITILICYLILGLHEFGTCQGGRSWMFGGMAQRMAYALQLHKDLDHDPKDRTPGGRNSLTFTDREIRRRTMWSCFLMDRFNSSGTDRPVFVGEQYIRAQLPIKENYYQMEINGPTEDLEGNIPNPLEPGLGQMANAQDNMGVAAYLVRLVSIWGRLIIYLNLGGKERDNHPMWDEDSRFRQIQKAVKDWKATLPASLEYNQENLQNHASEKIANQFIFLHILYNQTQLFMNRFALPSPGSRSTLPKEMPDDFISEAAQTALDAANQISELIREATDHLVVAPFAGYCAFFSSTVHIQGAFSKNAQLEASSKQNLAWNVKYLTKMKKYWGMFHFVTENLKELYRRHADAARSGLKGFSLPKDGEQAIFQYGDWFDRYPHGVSGTDYDEPSTDVKKEPGADAVLGQKSDLQTVEEFFSKLSPPSRAAHLQQAQNMRKMAKKRKSTSEGSKLTQPPTSQPQQDDKAMQNGHHPLHTQVTHDLDANINAGFAQHSIAFPPGFQPPHNPLISTPPQQYLHQLDRQMVLNSYGGNSNQGSLNGMLDGSGNVNFENLDMHAFANNHQGGGGGGGGQQSNNGFWGDPSTAWFMPFNMEPPTVGEDNNLFNGTSNLDWSNSFTGFADMAGMGATALTPSAIDTGQGRNMDGPDMQ
ncbi:hypothetical protein AC578_6072 [Pseudocercospora eumusae]|uniref:Zn(2)-C6 fungal-type domain-containing protein n=1 Tax=Pseudocercospora eumusae TaxID=321146 RepID=A0A139HVJ8_9PEZI|nr:hypothetical protein AC578_6072 [Pseudocercospora eumusae]